MSDAKLPISAVVICFNESRKIADCLRSLQWAEDLVVVDSLSTDGTPDIARQFTPRVYSQPWLGHVKQKNYACSLAQHDWVLSVDADEEVTPELRDEIFRLFQRPEGLVNGYRVPRRTFYLGRWIDHCGWLDAPLRLFRRSKGCFVGSDPHDRVEVEGEAGRLQHFLHHFNYEDVSDQAATVNRYSSIVAKGYFESGQRFSLAKLLFRPPLKFLETYVWKLGFLDGLPGLVICVMYAYQVFLRYAKLWELQTFGDKAGSGSAAPKDSPSGKPA
jgi:glycosyltransferase involved in cell wall biosynthesis